MRFPALQDSVTFLSDLQKNIAYAKKRVLIDVMIFEVSALMDQYVALLCDAAKRGIDVRLTVDWITLRYYGENLDVYPTLSRGKRYKRKKVIKLANNIVSRLQRAGVHVAIDNTPSWLGKIFLLSKRNHNKIFIVDDVAWIGGVNLIKDPEGFVDFMIKIIDSQILKCLVSYERNKPRTDKKMYINNTYSLLVDSGRKGKSLIYHEACKAILHARRTVILVSQMLPDEQLLSLLLEKSRKRVTIQVIISNRGHNIFTKFPFRYHYDLFQKRIQHNQYIHIFHSSHRIHAKALIIDDKKAFFGSHNFEKWNELIGIEETDFLTTDRRVIRQLNAFWRSIVQ